MRAQALLVVSAFALAGCGGEDDAVTLYLAQRLGADGPRGQIAPVLEPVGRERRPELAAATQVLVQLRQGPTPKERARGFLETVSPSTRFPRIELRRSTALVDVAGRRLDRYGVAAVVLSLTELPHVARVRVCCLHRRDGTRVFVHTRADVTGTWQGTPCALRVENPCLRDE